MKSASHKGTNTVQFHLHEVPGVVKIIERRMVSDRSWWEGCWGLFNGGGVSDLQDERSSGGGLHSSGLHVLLNCTHSEMVTMANFILRVFFQKNFFEEEPSSVGNQRAVCRVEAREPGQRPGDRFRPGRPWL